MRASIKKGFGFGLTSGIITTLGLIIGLYSSTKSASVILEGIVIIAIADSLSDALGMHISEESNPKNSKRHIWEATFSTMFFKFIITLSFVFPFLIWKPFTAAIISIAWGLSLISIFSYHIAKGKKQPPHKAITEHLIITIIVIILTYFIGELVSKCFGNL